MVEVEEDTGCLLRMGGVRGALMGWGDMGMEGDWGRRINEQIWNGEVYWLGKDLELWLWGGSVHNVILHQKRKIHTRAKTCRF